MEAAVIRAATDPLLHPIHLPVQIRTELARTAVQNRLKKSPVPKLPEDTPSAPALHADHMRDAEKGYLQAIATAAGGEIPEMCRLSGLSRAQVYRLIKKHNPTLA